MRNMKIKWDKNTIMLAELIGGIAVLLVLIVLAIMLMIRNNRRNLIHDDIVIEVVDGSENGNNEPGLILGENETDSPGDVTASSAIIDLTKENEAASKVEPADIYISGNMRSYTKDNYQLPELYAYWDDYRLDAVNDLIRLERVREITDSLGNSSDYYYHGETNSKGLPDGRGLAVYAKNTYYFGEWKNGKRSGDGMWLQIFLSDEGVVNGVKGVTEHQYSGTWSNDLPNGAGQEHIEYDYKQIEGAFVINNAIGDFKDGYYNGKMYIMTVDSLGKTTDWYGNAKAGSFEYLSEKVTVLGKRAIWKVGEGSHTEEEDGCRWIMPEDNNNFGVARLKK